MTLKLLFFAAIVAIGELDIAHQYDKYVDILDTDQAS